MKKKLRLHRQTIRALTPRDLRAAVAAATATCTGCISVVQKCVTNPCTQLYLTCDIRLTPTGILVCPPGG